MQCNRSYLCFHTKKISLFPFNIFILCLKMSQIKVDFNSKSITESSRVKLIVSIIDLLLYSRKQIPFSIKIFEKFVCQNTKIRNDSNQDSNWKNFKQERQFLLAKETLDSIYSLRKVSCSNRLILFEKKSPLDLSKLLKKSFLCYFRSFTSYSRTFREFKKSWFYSEAHQLLQKNPTL